MSTVKVLCVPCFFCGKQGTVEVLEDDLEKWRNGMYVQNAFPEMPAGDREMLISGTHSECWDENMGDEDDDE